MPDRAHPDGPAALATASPMRRHSRGTRRLVWPSRRPPRSLATRWLPAHSRSPGPRRGEKGCGGGLSAPPHARPARPAEGACGRGRRGTSQGGARSGGRTPGRPSSALLAPLLPPYNDNPPPKICGPFSGAGPLRRSSAHRSLVVSTTCEAAWPAEVFFLAAEPTGTTLRRERPRQRVASERRDGRRERRGAPARPSLRPMPRRVHPRLASTTPAKSGEAKSVSARRGWRGPRPPSSGGSCGVAWSSGRHGGEWRRRRGSDRLGLYYSPSEWGSDVFQDEAACDQHFLDQIAELHSGYGAIDMLWFDACGSEGQPRRGRGARREVAVAAADGDRGLEAARRGGRRPRRSPQSPRDTNHPGPICAAARRAGADHTLT